MSTKIPAPPVFTNNKTPYLTPQILVDVQLEDVTRTTANVAGQTLVTRYDRIANVDVQLLYIRQSALDSALIKVLTNIQNSINTNLNPEVTAGTTPLALDTEETSIPKCNLRYKLITRGK